METFVRLRGVAAPMDMMNIDTDQIIPKLHLRTIKRTGLGKVVFDELRFNPDGSEKPDFVLNQEPYRAAKILVVGENFGCGSSCEHAPWALLSLHANPQVPAHWHDQLERLIRSTARGAVARERLPEEANGEIVYPFTRPWADGHDGQHMVACGACGDVSGSGATAPRAPGALGQRGAASGGSRASHAGLLRGDTPTGAVAK